MKLINHDPTSVDQVRLWYLRQKGSKQVVLDKRTPLIVASMYGSLDVLKKNLSLSRRDVNRSSGDDQSTALHCAASSGSLNAKWADPNLMDAYCLRPVDMIVDSSEYPDLKHALHEIFGLKDGVLRMKPNFESKIEYHVDPSLPKTKIKCPFLHPGEIARRWDPHKYPYSCVPCPEFRKGTCRSGDLCEHGHGTFECWMHPAKYWTRLCVCGTGCNRHACFLAHNQEELRLLDVKSPSPSGNGIHFQSMSPQSIEAISPMRARGLNLAPDYQHRQSQESDWVVNKKEPDLSWILSCSLSDQSSFSPKNKLSVFNQLHQQKILSPFNINLSTKNAPFGVESMSPLSMSVRGHSVVKNRLEVIPV
ncbi:hypothetical protein CTI12_AA243100 [Artemisia annua]|uniref:C3H1-type domain-containing protein n=1 Tax=Artemisia annua TaxID=35608 RepID=A0A2U1NQ05_ARTAN|nr:hypothetical protein CTI12_AA243100 [Artemisia annua]